MEIRVPYGRSFLSVDIPDQIGVDIIEPPQVPASESPLEVVEHALDGLMGSVEWSSFSGAKSVAIAVNDKTRPVPHEHLLPPLLDRLERVGIPDEAITFYIAVGTHPPMTPDEFSGILPDSILQRYRVVSHNAEDSHNLISLGETSRQTPIWVNREYYQSDVKITVGNIAPHQFVGFSGGVKTAAIGLAGIETVIRNHSLMTHSNSQLGAYASNPARQDIEEIGQKLGVHLALNAILTQDMQIISALAGDPVAVVQEGIPLARKVCQVAVSQKYKLIISSPGGHPKDINVYQSQKGLAHAARIARAGGTIILAAACSEGTGSPHYEEWMAGKQSYLEVIQYFQREGFQIGPHKAYQFARDASEFRLMLYSELDHNLADTLLLNPIRDIQSALDTALVDLQPGEHLAFLPHAASTIPYLDNLRGTS